MLLIHNRAVREQENLFLYIEERQKAEDLHFEEGLMK